MKTENSKIMVKTICTLLILFTLTSLARAYPPENAAVLYYRAFMIVKEPDKDVMDMMRQMREGKIKSNNEIKQSVEENRRALELLETAVDIPNCDWGHDDSRGFDMLMPELGRIRMTVFLVTADAQILAENGNYKAALKKCLIIHKIARHAGDDLLISWLVGSSLNSLANSRIQDILSVMPADLQTLQWLKSEMVAVSSNVGSIKTAMKREKELAVNEIRREKIDTILASLGDDFLNDKANADHIIRLRNADDKFFADSRAYYLNVMTDAIAALDLPYQQSHKRLEEINERVRKESQQIPDAVLTGILTPAATKVCSSETRNRTFFNAVIAAIDVYIAKARTGRLPGNLPADSPKDLFSGQNFEYAKTAEGFILRCQGKDLDKDEIPEYEFMVKK